MMQAGVGDVAGDEELHYLHREGVVDEADLRDHYFHTEGSASLLRTPRSGGRCTPGYCPLQAVATDGVLRLPHVLDHHADFADHCSFAVTEGQVPKHGFEHWAVH